MVKLFLEKVRVVLEEIQQLMMLQVHLVTMLQQLLQQLQELVIQSHQQIQHNQLQKILSEVRVQCREKTLLVGIPIQCRSEVPIQVKVI